jgi:PKD repeat protein
MKTITLSNSNGTRFTFTKTDTQYVNVLVTKANGQTAEYVTIKSAKVIDGSIAASRADGSDVRMPIDAANELNDFLSGRELVALNTIEEVRAAEADSSFGKTFMKNGVMHAYKYGA